MVLTKDRNLYILYQLLIALFLILLVALEGQGAHNVSQFFWVVIALLSVINFSTRSLRLRNEDVIIMLLSLILLVSNFLIGGELSSLVNLWLTIFVLIIISTRQFYTLRLAYINALTLLAVIQIILFCLSSLIFAPFTKYYEQYSLVRVVFLFDEPIVAGVVYSLLIHSVNNKIQRFIFTIAALSTLSLFTVAFVVFTYILLSLKSRGLMLALIFGLLVSIVSYTVIGERIESLISLKDGSTNIRIALFLAQISSFIDSPLFGIGYGNELWIEYMNNGFASAVWMSEISSQSFLMQLVSSFGLIGFVFILIVFLSYNESQYIGFLTLIVLFTFIGFFSSFAVILSVSCFLNNQSCKNHVLIKL